MRFAFVALLAISCSSGSEASPPAQDAAPEAGPRAVVAGGGAYEKAGPNGVGHAIFVLDDATRTRALTVQAWYPSTSKGTTPIEELVVDAADRATFTSLLAKAPSCARRTVGSVANAPPTSDRWPLIVFSHCHECLRFSAAAIAERLASHGFAVLAPDHAGNTLFDGQRGEHAPLNGSFLDVRRGDVMFVLDEALDGKSLPTALQGKFDATKVGVFGHSYGGATTGLVLARDPRVKAGVAIAAPMENDLLPPAKMAEIHQPVMFLLAREDNSISEIGNNIIRSNFRIANKPIWLEEVDDAGHWSFSDLAGLTSSFAAGCGQGDRQTDPGASFWYLDNDGARALAASYVTSFFAATLNGDAAAKAFLTATHPSGVVTPSSRE